MENRLYPKFILTWSFPEDFLKGQQACVVLSVLYGKKKIKWERGSMTKIWEMLVLTEF